MSARGVALVVTALSLGAHEGRAHEEGGHDRHLPTLRLEPALDPEGLVGVPWAGVPNHLSWDLGLLIGYENNPLYLYAADPSDSIVLGPLDRSASLITNRLHGDLIAGIALFDWLQLGVDLPFILSQTRDESTAPDVDAAEPLGATALGDLRVEPKIRILRSESGAPFDAAFLIPFTLPSGATFDYAGEPGVSVTPTVAMSKRVGDLRLAGSLGYRAREAITAVGLRFGNEVPLRVGVGYIFEAESERPVELSAAYHAAFDTALDPSQLAGRQPMELLGEVEATLLGPLSVFAGSGTGIISGNGGPDFRFFGGVRVAGRPAPKDVDQDGIPDKKDTCPATPEDVDGVQDLDGCPEALDPDGDGFVEALDRCPDQAEDKNGVADDDGCPEDDPDLDGVIGAQDNCRTVAEDKDGFKDDDGCPESDNDGDGVLDARDTCANEAEDKDGFQDDDGCPEKDNDGDGVLDAADGCPIEAGPRENRGCPDKDRDGDTVVDRLDNCPDEAGIVENGGCAQKQLVVLTAEKLEIKDRVFFQTGKDVIERKSFALLDNVAQVLTAHPEIQLVRVEGHTDNVGDASYNKDLSQRRAESVRKYLVGKGVAQARLQAAGFGPERPIASNDTDDGKAQNRRVEFVIVGADTPPNP